MELDAMKKIDELAAKIVKDFEERPIATSIKGIFVLYVIKKGIEWLRN